MRDLRIPIGSFFVLVGVIVTITGAVTGNHARLETVNVDVYGGLSMLLFGGVMLWLSRRSS